MRNEALVPEGWQVARLGDVACERNQRANSGPQAEVFSVTKHSGFVRSLEYFGRQVFSRDTSNYKIVRRGDLAYATIHLDEGSLGILRDTEIGMISPMYTVFEVDRTQTEPEFLFSLMKLPQMVAKYTRIGEGSVHRRKSISFENLSRLSMVIPVLAEQRRILAVLDSIDEAIESTEAVVAATECLRDALLHELLTRGVPGWHSEWKHAPGIGTIPASWEVVRLGDVCSPPEYGATAAAIPFDPELPRYVRITDLTDDGRLRTEDARSAKPSEVNGYELEPGDLLFARSGATVGKTYLYNPQDGPCVYAGYLIRFRAMPSISLPEFLGLWTHSYGYHRWVVSMFRAGAQPNINAAEYSSMRIPLPTPNEQRTIAAMLGSMRDAIVRGQTQADVLRSLKASAADALLTGRVRVASEGDTKHDFKEH